MTLRLENQLVKKMENQMKITLKLHYIRVTK